VIATHSRSPQLEWVRPPRQGRSQQTLERLLQALEDLLEDKGFDDVGVAEIARRARSSVGSFYARFADKTAALRALHERFCEEAYATADDALAPARWQGATIARIVPATIAFLVRVHRERRGLFRAVTVQALSDADFKEREQKLGRYVNERVCALLHARSDEISHPDPRIAADFAMRQLSATLLLEIGEIGWAVGLIPFGDEQIAAELTCSFLAYLGVRDSD